MKKLARHKHSILLLQLIHRQIACARNTNNEMRKNRIFMVTQKTPKIQVTQVLAQFIKHFVTNVIPKNT
jgi:hypothetical protein